MLDSNYHMTLKLLNNHVGVKMSRFRHHFRKVIIDAIALSYQICKPLVVERFYCMALYHSQTQRHVINRDILYWSPSIGYE